MPTADPQLPAANRPNSNVRWRIAQFFELRWWKRYLANKDKQAYLDWKRAYWQRFLGLSGIEIAPNARVLDAGCGPAGIFTILQAREVHALDPLLDHYEAELPHFHRADYPQVRFFNQPLENFTPAGEGYDVVFCLNAINHVADLEAAFDRLVALTRPGGTLAVSVDAHNYWLLKRIFRLVPGDILHPHQFDLMEYESMLTRRGLRVERTVLVKKELIFNYFLLVATRAK